MAGMVLLDLVMVTATQQFLIHSEKSKGLLLINLLGAYGDRFPHLKNEKQGKNDFQQLTTTLDTHQVPAALWATPNGDLLWEHHPAPQLGKSLQQLIRTTLRAKKKQTAFYGTTWGVFWKQPKYLLSAAPYYVGTDIIGYAGIAIQLDPVFEQLRETQKIIGIYLFINTCLLTLIGIYRIYTIVLRPVAKMTELAESYRPEDGVFLLEESEEDEHSKLSRSINRILKLNQDDQEKLQQTVSQLEGALHDLKKAQQEIIRSEKLATVGRLSAGIAHEIGNPIGIVLGYLSLLKENEIDAADRADYIDRAESEVNRIRTIIRQLLNYSTPSKQSMQNVSIHGLIEDVVQMAQLQPLFSKIKVTAELNAEVDQVLANPDQVRQLFLNFIVNAADALDVGDEKFEGCLQIRSEIVLSQDLPEADGKRMIRIRFEDNGQGISQEGLEKIFDPFYTTKPVGKGSGLGLWVSLLIAEGMGGKITAESDIGEGTVMSLLLPIETGS